MKKENFHSNTWILRMQLVLEVFRARLDDIQVQYEQVKDDIINWVLWKHCWKSEQNDKESRMGS